MLQNKDKFIALYTNTGHQKTLIGLTTENYLYMYAKSHDFRKDIFLYWTVTPVAPFNDMV